MCGIAGWIGWDDGNKYKQPIVDKINVYEFSRRQSHSCP